MGDRRARFLAVCVAFCGALLCPISSFADPVSEFTRLPFGHAVTAWFPLDVNNDSLWELAITCAGTPARVGIFSPATGGWIDGPRPLPTSSGLWGAGDFDNDGLMDYAYVRSDTMRFYDPTTDRDSAAWAVPFHCQEAIFWGRNPSGHCLVGLREGRYSHTYDSTWTWVQESNSEKYIIHVYDLVTGTQAKEIGGGNKQCRLVSDIPTRGATQLMVYRHEYSRMYSEVFGMGIYSCSNLDSVMLVDSVWNFHSVLGFHPAWVSQDMPTFPLSLNQFASIHLWNPPRELLFAEVSEETDYRPQMAAENEGSHTLAWSYAPDSGGAHRNFAAYDLHGDGNSALYLPLNSGQGWEVRTLSHGAITDTLPGMPFADLQTGPLITAGHQDLFYLADSSLYIWGMPTSVNDDQPPPANLPSTPWLTAYPNPFNASIRLTWSPSSSTSTLEVLNILGQRIRTYNLTTSSVEWDSRDGSGRTVPSGIYFARLTGSHSPIVKKLVLLK